MSRARPRSAYSPTLTAPARVCTALVVASHSLGDAAARAVVDCRRRPPVHRRPGPGFEEVAIGAAAQDVGPSAALDHVGATAADDFFARAGADDVVGERGTDDPLEDSRLDLVVAAAGLGSSSFAITSLRRC